MQINFNYLSTLIKSQSGIMLEQDKIYLIESRLYPVAKKYGFNNIIELVDHVKEHNNKEMVYDIVDAMTTHETLFFRDPKVFSQIKDVLLPKLKADNPGITKINVWSSACSSGQEPYSMAMMLSENPGIGLDCDILGTDLSKKIIEKAQKGEFTQFEVQRGLPITLLMKYFHSSNENWYINEQIKSKVKYQDFNLLSDFTTLPMKNFNIVFCRNVLIYFDVDTKAKILNDISKVLVPNGFLIIGTAETVFGAEDKYVPLGDTIGIYQLKS